jgi:pilus assembly protein CpaC
MRQRSLPVWVLLLAAVIAAAPIDAAVPAFEELNLTLGTGIVIDCPEIIARVSTSAPEVVDAVTASSREVLFHAKGLGKATLVVWSKSGQRKTYNVTVELNLDPMRRLLRETFPDEEIDIRATRDSMALVGRVSSQAVADRALALVTASAKGAVSNLQIAPAGMENQVVLRVRFAELNRSAVSEFGVNLLSTGALNTIGRVTTGQFPAPSLGSVTGSIPASAAGTTSAFSFSDLLNIFAFRPDLNLGAVISDLQTRGLVQILAEPNLVATSGKEASFLAGGEIPVPVAQGGPLQERSRFSTTSSEFVFRLRHRSPPTTPSNST